MSEECPGCRLPRIFRWYVKWGDNGTIVMRLNPAVRTVLVESALLEDIYQRIEAAMGFPIRHIVFEAERAASKAVIDTMVPAILKPLVRNQLVMHPISRLLQLLARLGGMADVHTVFYRVFKGSMASVRNPMSRDIFAAMVVGAFESAEGTYYGHQWLELGGKLYLVIMPAGKKPLIAERMAPEVRAPLAGNRTLELCPGCGFPVALRHLDWDMPNGTITDTRRGVRMSFVDGYAFSAVFRELVSELGEDVVPIIIEASREYTRRRMQETGFLSESKGRETVYREFLDLLPLHGQGNPVSDELAGNRIAVTIENPYSVHLLAGQMLAVFEAVEGRDGSIDIDEPAPQRVLITVG